MSEQRLFRPNPPTSEPESDITLAMGDDEGDGSIVEEHEEAPTDFERAAVATSNAFNAALHQEFPDKLRVTEKGEIALAFPHDEAQTRKFDRAVGLAVARLPELVVQALADIGISVSVEDVQARMDYDEPDELDPNIAASNSLRARSGEYQIDVTDHTLCEEVLYREENDPEAGVYEFVNPGSDPAAPSFFDVKAMARAMQKLAEEFGGSNE